MWNSEIERKKPGPGLFLLSHGFLMGFGVSLIIAAVLVLGFSVYEGFFNGGKMRVIQLPGFHELQLDTAGLYAGLYQHRGRKPMPIKELSQMDVRVMSKDDYEEVPVLMNSAGQTVNRLGFQAMPLFNFAISKPGAYTLSGVYTGEVKGPTVPVLVFPQNVQNVKQTMLVGATFFVAFLALGILILIRARAWSHKKI